MGLGLQGRCRQQRCKRVEKAEDGISDLVVDIPLFFLVQALLLCLVL